MGFFDFFKRVSKTKRLPEATGEQTQSSIVTPNSSAFDQAIKVDTTPKKLPTLHEQLTLDPNTQTQVFISPDSTSKIITYQFARDNLAGDKVILAELSGFDGQHSETLKDLAHSIDIAIDKPSTIAGTNIYSLERLKKESKQYLMELAQKNRGLSLKDDIFQILDNIRIDPTKLKEILNKHGSLDYKQLDRALVKSIDLSRYSREEIQSLGEILQERLSELDSIKTPNDAYDNQTSIKSFMKSKEEPTPIDKFISLLGDDLTEENVPIILKFAKSLENLNNEDGLLYSSYLKLEEKRILSQIQEEIIGYYSTLENDDSTSLECQEQCEHLESLKIANATSGDPFGIIDYMTKTMQGSGLEEYISDGVKSDIRLKSFLQKTPIPHQKEALTYVGARISSLGQVSNIPEEERKSKFPTLRQFIETTDCKSPDNDESKKFLLVMASTEKTYIEKSYGKILESYMSLDRNQSINPTILSK